MRCPLCNAEVGSDDIFCGACGKRLPSRPKGNRRTRTPVLVAIVLALVAGCLITGVLAITLGGAIPSFLPVACPTLSPSPGVPWLTYDSHELGLSLKYPEGWLLEEDLHVQQVVFAPEEENLPADAFLVGTSFIVSLSHSEVALLATPQEALQSAAQFLGETYPDTDVGEIEPRRIAGQDGAWMTIDGEFERKGTKLRGWMAAILAYDYAYLLAGAAPAEDWSSQQPILDSMLDSVRVSEPCLPPPPPKPPPLPTPTRLPTKPASSTDAYEPDNTPDDANSIDTNGTSQSHNFHVAGDHDYVRFMAHQGVGYTIETSHLGSDVDTIIYLYDGEENEIVHNDDGGEERLASRITWIAPSGGTYYVMIRDLGEDSAGSDAPYDVLVISAGAIEGADSYEPDDSISQASWMGTDGTSQTHTLHATADVDYVYFLAEEGVEYTVETGNLGAGCDTVLALCDADGTELDYDDDAGEESWASRIVWTAPSRGTYYVAVRDFSGTAGPGISYQVWLTR